MLCTWERLVGWLTYFYYCTQPSDVATNYQHCHIINSGIYKKSSVPPGPGFLLASCLVWLRYNHLEQSNLQVDRLDGIYLKTTSTSRAPPAGWWIHDEEKMCWFCHHTILGESRAGANENIKLVPRKSFMQTCNDTTSQVNIAQQLKFQHL